jgi:hypothetical protein
MTAEIIEGPALTAVPDTPEPQQSQAHKPPITVYCDDGRFEVPGKDSWGYMEVGIFASGYWFGREQEAKDVLIPYERIRHIEFDFSAIDDVPKAEDEQPAD